jgi:hypothetical protein
LEVLVINIFNDIFLYMSMTFFVQVTFVETLNYIQ